HGDALVRPRSPERRDQVADRLALGARGIVARDAMDARLTLEVGARGDAREMPYGAAAHVVGEREDTRERLIAPVDERRRRAEIAAQLERLQRDRRQARSAHGGESPDFGIAEAVDGLHRIADEEQRIAVT